MRILQITPGAGKMYCGNCLRDNALVRTLRARGHDVLMLPVYLPLTLDEADESTGTPVFFGGINVYVEQLWPAYRKAPGWLLRALSSRGFLKVAAGQAAGTHPSQLGALTLSMLQGEEGNQARELQDMLIWLKQQRPFDAVVLSNALLCGMARKLKQELNCPVACQLSGEDSFLDGLPEPYRQRAWAAVTERVNEVDIITAPSAYFARVMSERLGIRLDRIRIISPGINLEGFSSPETLAAARRNRPPVLGFFTRMCKDKGLDLLIEAFIQVRRSGQHSTLRLKVGGYCGKSDGPFISELKSQISSAGLDNEVEFHPNVDRSAKIALLESLSLFSVPAVYGEAFGLYLIEAMAAGVPVIQPNTAAFPEIVNTTGGGLLFSPNSSEALAIAIAELAAQPARAAALGAAGSQAVRAFYTSAAMATAFENVLRR